MGISVVGLDIEQRSDTEQWCLKDYDGEREPEQLRLKAKCHMRADSPIS